MSEIAYFDTSALAKWYLNEARSEEAEKYLQEPGPVAISDSPRLEMRCLLARRRREQRITATMKIFAVFQEDIRQRHLVCHPLPSGLTAGAVNLRPYCPRFPREHWVSFTSRSRRRSPRTFSQLPTAPWPQGPGPWVFR